MGNTANEYIERSYQRLIQAGDGREFVPPPWRDYDDPDLLEDANQPSRILYHYTSTSGFHGIVESNRLRATHHRYLNDVGEIEYGLSVVRQVLDDLRACISDAVRDRVLAKLDWLRERDSFLACMSASPEVLSQWRAYADGGAGYCIGFRIDKPLASHGYHGINWFRHLLECQYERALLEGRLKDRFQRKIARVANLPATGDNKDDVLALELAMVAWRYAHLAKHHHFKEEREWRIVADFPTEPETGAVSYRVGPLGLTPYTTIEEKIEEVWIGPGVGPTPDHAKKAVERFLQGRGLSADIEYWASPYVRR